MGGAGTFVFASIVSGFIVAVGLPMAIGIFFRGFMKNANPNIPALMAATVMFGLQQVVVYRGDARITTVLPRIQSWLPESVRYEMYAIVCITIVLIFAGVIIPFVFAKMGIRFSDFMDRVSQKITNFFDRMLHRK
ncbi:MAG: hypothetical protein A2283_06245 [Lentisphaerae bacterium RIFOXYA12_FULL_48_11]|nr:MAG: hypothetical protein A2283_06245 [Lentisphaerae bacterium RIFOXYA12_FULL_48_11]